jgi:hypothetical protein
MEKLRRARYVLPAVHSFLFIAMWASYAVSNSGLGEGLPGLFFFILMVVDLPFSFVAFGVMFEGGKYGTIAAIAWGLGGTLWWCLLGLAFDALIRRFRRNTRSSGAGDTGQTTH